MSEQTPLRDRGDGDAVKPDLVHQLGTIPNLITIARLLLVPIFLIVLLSDAPNHDALAFTIFAVAALTDFLDGFVARATHTVTSIGKALDPLVDRLLIASAVIGLYLVGRLPLWVLVFFILRDAWLAAGGLYLTRHGLPIPPVSWTGKWTTAVALIGFSLLILGWPSVPAVAGSGPSSGSGQVLAGVYLVYAAVALSAVAAIQYTVAAAAEAAAARSAAR
jgi:cardiolipin synthase